MRQRAAGFTLIELLVVMAIITILSSIIFPTLSQAREKARQTTCLSNIKQLCYAVLMYADDYDEGLPPSVQRYGNDPIADDNLIWTTSIMTYVNSDKIFICPDAKADSYFAATWGERGRLSFGLNRDLEERATNVPYQMFAFSNPQDTVLIADSTPGDTNVPDNARGFQVEGGCKPDTQWGVGCRHNGGTNVGFLDGHAKWHNSARIWQKDNPSKLQWTID